LLSELYRSSERALMQGGDKPEDIQAQRRERLDARIASALRSEHGERLHAMEQALSRLPWRCVMHFAPRQLHPMAELLLQSGVAVKLFVDKVAEETLVMVLAQDRQYLFASLASALAMGHINVMAAQAFDLKDGRVLDVFHVQDMQGKCLHLPADLERVQKRIHHALEHVGERPDMPPRLPMRKITLLMRQVPVRVRRLAVESSHQTTIEVAACDQPALLARLAWTISEMSFSLKGAVISSFGDRVVDVFFIERMDGGCLVLDEVNDLCARLKHEVQLPEA